MCHSVEMYMPRLTQAAAEHRLGATDRGEHGYGHGPALAATARNLWTALRGLAGRAFAPRPALPRATEEVG